MNSDTFIAPIEACDFCTALIRINITSIFNPVRAGKEKKMLFSNIRNKHIELSHFDDSEIKEIISEIYERNIDNDKYGRNVQA